MGSVLAAQNGVQWRRCMNTGNNKVLTTLTKKMGFMPAYRRFEPDKKVGRGVTSQKRIMFI
jgi:hypothetical protein